MTVEEAKLILAAHRAESLDPADADVRQALDLLAAMPDLAAWWEEEQAFDRAFAKKLTEIAPPPELHEAIMRGGTTIFAARTLIQESAEDAAAPEPAAAPPASAGGGDAAEQKIVQFYALEAERHHSRRPLWHQFVMPATLAASLGLALLGVSMFFASPPLPAQPELPEFTQYATALVDGKLPPQQQSERLADIQAYLDRNHAPAPAQLPARLAGVRPWGCGVQEWHAHKAAVVHLHNAEGKVNLFILRRDEFQRDKVTGEPVLIEKGKFDVFVWSEGENIYVLLDDETTTEQ